MTAEQRAFQLHASVWFAVNFMLFVIWLITGAGHPWFLYPALGWGIGLAVHATATFNHPIHDEEIESGETYRQLGH